MRAHRILGLAALLGVVSMACSSSTVGNGNDAGTSPTPPPSPASDHPACVISADCPSGSHCDLGECVQSCNSENACAGDQTCTPRANCAPPSTPPAQADADPTTNQYAGTVSATPSDNALTDADKTLTVKLTTTSSGSVRYRVQINAPHLSIAQMRGEFTGETTLSFNVDTTALKGRDVGGTIKIFTTLGEIAVNAPIHVGLTGAYRGHMKYDGGAVQLGGAKLALQLIEKSGDVSMLVDSKASLLFPATSAGETTGSGSYTVSDGLDVTVAQVVPKAVGGDRNHFVRDVGRKVRFRLKPAAHGNLEGTFEETLYGLFTQPVTTRGTVVLEYQPRGEDPAFVLGATPTMPASPSAGAFLDPASVFKWAGGSCDATICSIVSCADATKIKSALTAVESAYGQPLQRSMDQSLLSNASPFVKLPAACKTAAAKTSAIDWYNDSNATQCNLAPELACGMAVATRLPAADIAGGKLFGRLTAEMLAPSLLVAKDEIVVALSDSFTSGGLAKEKSHYDTAMTAVGPAASWLLQPTILEFLRGLSPDAAKGDLPSDTKTVNDTYPAARAMADLLHTMSVVDGERSRIGAASSAATQPALVQAAQERALLTYLESAALAEILRSWGSAPSSVAVKLTGVLSPLDEGYSALTLGANAFGVPSGFVPFVYRPEDVGKGATNFEQMLSIAHTTVLAEQNIEGQFTSNKRTYEANSKDLQSQLTAVRNQYDLRLKDICGATFDPATIAKPADWASCGANHAGEVGGLAFDIEQAQARLRSAQSRIEGMKQKIVIAKHQLAQTQSVHEETLKFVDDTGAQLEAISFTEGMIDLTIKTIEIASNASIGNGGAPLAGAAAAAIIGSVKIGLDIQKQHLETAEKMRFEQAGAQIELINGMAEIQKQVIDLAQLSVDMQQDVLGVVQAQTRARTILENAQSLADERSRVLGITSQDPSTDPSFRILRDEQSLQVIKSRSEAQRDLYLSASALEYELNLHIPEIDGAVLNAHNAASLGQLELCLSGIYGQSRTAYGTPQDYSTTVSVRKMLGITGPRVDPVTGATLSEGEQFRQLLLRNANLDGKGGVGIVFSTDLQPGNQLWSTDVCNDRVSTVQAQLVGDFLGDNQAQVNLSLFGGAYMRRCDADVIESWSFGAQSSSSTTRIAVIQAGVNTFGEASPNTSLFGQSVARTSWQLVIPGASAAPTNADVDVTKIEDVVLKFGHKALPRQSSPISLNLSCLASIGG